MLSFPGIRIIAVKWPEYWSSSSSGDDGSCCHHHQLHHRGHQQRGADRSARRRRPGSVSNVERVSAANLYMLYRLNVWRVWRLAASFTFHPCLWRHRHTSADSIREMFVVNRVEQSSRLRPYGESVYRVNANDLATVYIFRYYKLNCISFLATYRAGGVPPISRFLQFNLPK